MAAPPSPSGAEAAAGMVGRVAGEAARLLGGGAAGVLLFGSQARAPVPRILDRVRALPLVPVRFDAADGTVEGLRAEVERVHAARTDPSTPLLLVVDDADRLGAALLHELEQAAAAAAELGGLTFLFVAATERGQDLAEAMRRQALPALARCMEAGLRCDRAAAVPDAGERPYRRPAAPAPPPTRLLPRLLVAVGILALLAVVLAVGISHLRIPAPASQVAPLSVPPPLSRAPMPIPSAPPPPPVAAPGPAAPVPPAPAPQVPARPAPTPPPVPAATVPPQPASASLLLIAGPGDTLASLYARVYQGTTPPPFARVAALNPAVIVVGTRLVFPAPAAGWSPTR